MAQTEHTRSGNRTSGHLEIAEDRRTPEEWLSAAEEYSQRVLKTDVSQAWRRVQQGEFEGTHFEAELSQFMFLAGKDQDLPQAAE